MKKIIALLLAVVMLVAVFAACGAKQEEPAKTPEQNQEADANDKYFGHIKPLEEKTKLVVASPVGAIYISVSYIAQKLGICEDANLDLEIVCFGNGPVMVEAFNQWDAGVYGFGGTQAGILKGVTLLGDADKDHATMYVFNHADSEIAKSPANAKGILGTAEQWKGQEVYLPVGTVQHYVYLKALEDLGLTADDVSINHMDMTNANTAFRAGQGDATCLSGNLALGMKAETEKYTVVADADKIGAYAPSALVANTEVLKDSKKREAIKKWLEIHFATVAWTRDNVEQAAEWYLEFAENEGVKSTYESCLEFFKLEGLYTLEDNYNMFFKEKSPDGKMSLLAWTNYSPLQFFVDQGKQPESILQDLLDTIDDSLVKEIYEAKTK